MKSIDLINIMLSEHNPMEVDLQYTYHKHDNLLFIFMF